MAANRILYSGFVRDFAVAGVLVGYIALEAALRGLDVPPAPETGPTAGPRSRTTLAPRLKNEPVPRIEKELQREQFLRAALWPLLGEKIAATAPDFSQVAADALTEIYDRTPAWREKWEEAAKLRNALAHGDKEFFEARIADPAGEHLQFIAELMNRVAPSESAG